MNFYICIHPRNHPSDQEPFNHEANQIDKLQKNAGSESSWILNMPFKNSFIVVDFITMLGDSLLFFCEQDGHKRRSTQQDLGPQTLIQSRIFYSFGSLSGSLTFKKCLRKHSSFNLLLPHICISLMFRNRV